MALGNIHFLFGPCSPALHSLWTQEHNPTVRHIECCFGHPLLTDNGRKWCPAEHIKVSRTLLPVCLISFQNDLTVDGELTTSLPWFTSFSSSSIGLMRVLGQNSSSAWSSSPPRFTTEMNGQNSSVSFNSFLYIKCDWVRYLTLWVGPIRARKPSILCRHPGSEAVALIQCDSEHLSTKRHRTMRPLTRLRRD